MLPGRGGYFFFDSLAVEADGAVSVATIIDGGITTLSAGDGEPRFVAMPDRLTTNIAFGGEDMCTAVVTLSSTGRLVSLPWPRPGLKLNFAPA